MRVQVIVGGDHGNMAFQFGTALSVTLIDDQVIDFEVSVCELTCRKDTGKLIESTILQTLTRGMDIVATRHLHIEINDQEQIECRFRDTPTLNSLTIDMYVTGDSAFQAMVLGKELLVGWWCMLCKSPKSKFMDNAGEMWNMYKYVRCGLIAENKKNRP